LASSKPLQTTIAAHYPPISVVTARQVNDEDMTDDTTTPQHKVTAVIAQG
jgi:hypothetical protein